MAEQAEGGQEQKPQPRVRGDGSRACPTEDERVKEALCGVSLTPHRWKHLGT